LHLGRGQRGDVRHEIRRTEAGRRRRRGGRQEERQQEGRRGGAAARHAPYSTPRGKIRGTLRPCLGGPARSCWTPASSAGSRPWRARRTSRPCGRSGGASPCRADAPASSASSSTAHISDAATQTLAALRPEWVVEPVSSGRARVVGYLYNSNIMDGANVLLRVDRLGSDGAVTGTYRGRVVGD